MRIYGKQTLKELQQRASLTQWKDIVEKQRKNILEYLEKPIFIPSRDIQTEWVHRYICRTCNGELQFDPADSKRHRCEMCGEYSEDLPGEHTLEAAWHSKMHSFQSEHAIAITIMGAIDNDKKMLNYAKNILLMYAGEYEYIKEHGDAAGTGKVMHQSLTEATWLLPLCATWRILKDLCILSEEEQQEVCNKLFRTAIDLLIRQTCHIHNIHVWHSAAIAYAAIACEDKHALNFAKKMINRNIVQGILNGGMWYEISVHYHYYTLSAFLWYEAALIENGLVSDHQTDIESMLYAPLDLVLENGNFPLINDGWPKNQISSRIPIYEKANAIYSGFEKINNMLHSKYNAESHTFQTFLSGGNINKTDEFLQKPITVTDGQCMLRKKGFTAAIKATPNAGGHDHPDRLSLNIYMPDSDMFAGDMGNPGYGSPYHEAYFKTTCAHNTFIADDTDQLKTDGYIRKTIMLDEFSLMCANADNIYPGVNGERKVIVADDWIIDISYIYSDKKHKINWLFHAKANLFDTDGNKTSGCNYQFVSNKYVNNQICFAENQWQGFWIGQDNKQTRLNVKISAAGLQPRIGSISCPNIPTTQRHDCLITEVVDKQMITAAIFSRENVQTPEIIYCTADLLKFKLPDGRIATINQRNLISIN